VVEAQVSKLIAQPITLELVVLSFAQLEVGKDLGVLV